jgi:hypothetical protein
VSVGLGVEATKAHDEPGAEGGTRAPSWEAGQGWRASDWRSSWESRGIEVEDKIRGRNSRGAGTPTICPECLRYPTLHKSVRGLLKSGLADRVAYDADLVQQHAVVKHPFLDAAEQMRFEMDSASLIRWGWGNSHPASTVDCTTGRKILSYQPPIDG